MAVVVTGASLLAACAGNAVHLGDDHPAHDAADNITVLAPDAVSREIGRLEKTLEGAFAAERKSGGIQLMRLSEAALLFQMDGDSAFDAGDAQLRAATLDILARLKPAVMQHDGVVIHVIACNGKPGDNARGTSLGERRAASVASYLAGLGVSGARLRYEGRAVPGQCGSGLAAHALALVFKPVIAGREQQAWMPPSFQG